MHNFLDTFDDETSGMRLTTLVQEIPSVLSPETGEEIPLNDLDDGLIGVLDRAVAKRACATDLAACGKANVSMFAETSSSLASLECAVASLL